jgi:D-3-phosphoglycerate dehydrogenase
VVTEQHSKWRVLVSDKLSDQGLAVLREDPRVEVVCKTGLSRDELKEEIREADALLVRSATKVTAEVIDAAKKLVAIGRAGVGVDNIDVEAATRRGIVVCNSPEGNTAAAVEHTWALMLALARSVPAANASVKAAEWRRSDFLGVELLNKTLGIIGLGKIGSEVAARARAFGMKVLGYDPFVSGEHMARLGVEAAKLDELLERSDFITLHVPHTKDTHHLLGREALAKTKPGARIINCARGGVVDEQALAEAVKEGRLAGAGLDVFESEPPKDTPLLGLDKVVLTPHLGASTAEAQIKVAVDVAQQVLDVLNGKPARSAINVIPVSPESLQAIEPYLPLAEKLGRLQGQLAEVPLTSVELTYAGQLADEDSRLLSRAFLKGLLEPILDEPVNLVNAVLVAEARGLRVVESRSREPEDYVSLITSRVGTDGGERVIAGTIFGRSEARIVRIDQYRVDFAPSGHMLVSLHIDQPGMIGRVGTILGQHSINIAGMHVGRSQPRPGGRSVMVLALDNPVPGDVLDEIGQVDGIMTATPVEL